MLNEPLYRAMTALFSKPLKEGAVPTPTPGITNEGVCADIRFPPPVASFLPCTTLIPTNHIRGGEQYTVNCPFCGDTRGRLYISAMWNVSIKIGEQVYVCSDRLIRCFNEECQKNRENRDLIIARLNALMHNKTVLDNVKLFSESTTEMDTDSLSNQVPLPPNMADIEHASVPQYIRDYWYNVRGFSAETLRKFGVKIAYMPYPIKRGCDLMQQPVTIIPVNQYGKYWFYQARLIPIDGKPENGYERNLLNDEYPKYYIPATAKKSWSLYNLDNAVKQEEIAIVEGPTDVWRLGDRAVAKFGRALSAAQRGILTRMFKNKRIILVPDMDDPLAYEEACKDQTILQNTGAFRSVRISVIEKGTDPGDLRLSEEEAWKFVLNRLSSVEGESHDGCGLRELL